MPSSCLTTRTRTVLLSSLANVLNGTAGSASQRRAVVTSKQINSAVETFTAVQSKLVNGPHTRRRSGPRSTPSKPEHVGAGDEAARMDAGGPAAAQRSVKLVRGRSGKQCCACWCEVLYDSAQSGPQQHGWIACLGPSLVVVTFLRVGYVIQHQMVPLFTCTVRCFRVFCRSPSKCCGVSFGKCWGRSGRWGIY